MVTLINPDGTILSSMREAELVDYLRQNDLVSAKLQSPDMQVVFARSVQAAIESALKRPESVLTSRGQIVEGMKVRLSLYGIAMFALKPKQIRHYLNTMGFVQSMSRLLDSIGGVVIVPPGIYGQRHYFAVRKATENQVDDS